MTTEHPITPPPELLEQWEAEVAHTTLDELSHVATQAARWGADQELEACCEWFLLEGWHPDHPNKLRAARRPKPSLKKQALALLLSVETSDDAANSWDLSVVRRALESLPE